MAVCQEYLRAFALGYSDQMEGDLGKLLQSLFHLLSVGFELRNLLGLPDGILHFRQKELKSLAVFHGDIAPQKGDPLNARGAFMDGMDPGIPIKLFQGKFIAVPVSPEDLQSCAYGRNPHLRGIALGHGGQEIQ